MTSQNRTFVLQAVGVAVVIGVIFFAFLRPTDVSELSGIDAPGDDDATFGLPGAGREGGKDGREGGKDGRERGKDSRGEPRGDDRRSNRARSVLTSAPAADGGPALPSGGNDPADDQYTSTATALMKRVMAPVDP